MYVGTGNGLVSMPNCAFMDNFLCQFCHSHMLLPVFVLQYVVLLPINAACCVFGPLVLCWMKQHISSAPLSYLAVCAIFRVTIPFGVCIKTSVPGMIVACILLAPYCSAVVASRSASMFSLAKIEKASTCVLLSWWTLVCIICR